MKYASLRRLLFIGGFLYLAYRMFHSQETIPTQQPSIFEYSQPDIQQQDTSSDRSIIFMPFYIAADVISWFFSTLWWLITLAWTALAFIMSILSYVWAVVMLIINGVYMVIAYTIFKRDMTANKTKFFVALVAFVIGPLIVNSLFSYKEFALNMFLPIYLALFVDVLGNTHMITGKTIRNFVFFVLICAFL